MKLISIVTVVYNGEKYLKDTIESVVRNKNNFVEYIVIDGGSTDETIKIAMGYKSSIDIFISEPDLGIFDAMNKGVSVANGKYVWFLNSDDFLIDGAISLILEKIFNENVDLDVIYGDIISKTKTGKYINCPTPNEILPKYFYNLPLHHPGSLVKKQLFNEFGGFNIEYKYSADYDLFLRLMLNNARFTKVYGNLACMREGGLGTINLEKSLLEFEKSLYINKNSIFILCKAKIRRKLLLLINNNFMKKIHIKLRVLRYGSKNS